MALVGEMQYLTIGNNTYSIAAGGLTTETDPVFSASAAAGISAADISNWNNKTSNTGTVTSVQVQATSPVQSSTSTAQSSALNTTISLADAYGDSKNPYGSKTKNYVLAAPSNAAGAPSFRALVAADIPDLSSTYLTSHQSIKTLHSKTLTGTGDVTLSYSDVGAAASSHTHGNITNGGDITATAPTIANGDQIIINDNSASKITNGPTFDGSTTTKALTPKGTWETFLQSYTETDPVFSASAAAGITSTDISNWNSKVSDTGKWNNVSLNKTSVSETGNESVYVPLVTSTSGTTAYLMEATFKSGSKAGALARYNANSYLISTTPSANDNSTKVATTAYVDSAIPDVSGYVSKSGDTMAGNLAMDSYDITFTNISADTRQTTTIQQRYMNSMGNYIGYLSVEGATIRNSYTPTHDYDLTNKQYVDTAIGTISVPTKTSDLTNDSGFITSYTETDPTVPAWAKASSKPTYTASEVGALPSTTLIPSKTSDLTNDSGFITSVPEEIFWVEYGTTTSAEIEAAYQAGKEMLMILGSSPYAVYRFFRRDSATKHLFMLPNGTSYVRAICENNVWSTTYTDLVPTTRTINGYNLSSNITLTPSDIGIHTSTSDPTSSDGNDGDVWLVYSVPESEPEE